MSEKRYDVFFTGQIIKGSEAKTVQRVFGTRFKVQGAKLDQFFSGKPMVLKRNVSEAEARKLDQAIRAVGALCHFRPAEEKAPPAPKPQTTQSMPSSPKSTDETDDLWDDDSPFASPSATEKQALSPPPLPPAQSVGDPVIDKPIDSSKKPPPMAHELASLELATPTEPETVPTNNHPSEPESIEVFDPEVFAARRNAQDAERARSLKHHQIGWAAIGSVLTLVLIFFSIWYWERNRTIAQPPGILVPEAPLQTNIDLAETFFHKGYAITPLADFSLRARVLGFQRYDNDYGGDVMPLDLALGWGIMSDNDILDEIRINQYRRFYYWSTNNRYIPLNAVKQSSANMHMVPANQTVWEIMKDARRGHIIALEGKLIRMIHPDGTESKSSLTRRDTGPGACEIIWVERFEIL